MSAPSIQGITHLSLSVRDLDTSLAFYSEVLGLPILVPPNDGVVFEGRQAMVLAGRIALSLQEHRANEGEAFEPVRTGLDHFAFAVSSIAELEAWIAYLDDAGVQHSAMKPAGDFGTMIELGDPDGVQLEVHTLEVPG